MRGHSLFNQFLSILYPNFCIVCGEKTDNPYPLCNECIGKIHEIKFPYCKKCGKPLEGWGSDIALCGECIRIPPSFKIARSGYKYEGILKDAIHRWKYGGDRSLSILMKELMVRALLKSDIPISHIDLLVYVPISRRTLKKRGFNQTKDMALSVGKRFSIPLYDGLKKKKGIMDQALLSREDRIRNIRGAFYLSYDFSEDVKNILIIDDVYTTGATVKEIAKLLNNTTNNLDIYIFTLSRGVL